MMASREMARGRLLGIGAVLVAWFMFALHDATVKLLVSDLSAWEVLFARSLVVLPLCFLFRQRPRARAATPWPVRRLLLLNAVIYALAWVAYYSAARHLQLAELETVYFASPLIATALAVLLLKESVPYSRWASLGLGIVGVALACGPASLENAAAVWLALLAAGLWALSVVLMRQLSASVSTVTQMVANNTVFLVLCSVLAPWWWRLPSGEQISYMALVGIASLFAQYLLYEGIRRVPASVASPLEYSGLLWSFGLGYLIWNDVPATAVFLGAGLIVLSGALVIIAEWQAMRAPPDPAYGAADAAAAAPTASA